MMLAGEKEAYMDILREINEEMPKPVDYYDSQGELIVRKKASKEAIAIADIAGILYRLLGGEVEK